MNTFALLSRSTRLRKNVAKPRAVSDTRSRSSNLHLNQSVPPNDADRIASGSGSRKRKRGREGAEAAGIPSLSIKQKGGSHHANENGTQLPAEDQSHGGSTAIGSQAYDDTVEMGEDARRSILRSHKLKITKLLESNETLIQADDTLSRNRKRRAKESGLEKLRHKKQKLEVLPQPLTSFSQLRSRYALPNALLANLDSQGFTVPTEVQIGSLPLLLPVPTELDASGTNGESSKAHASKPACNLLTVAPTGSGKTLAFLIPMINSIMQGRRRDGTERTAHIIKRIRPGPLAVILAPTKELVRQIVNEGRKLALNTGIQVTAVQKSTRLYSEGASHRDADSAHSDDEDKADEANGVPRQQPATKSHIIVATPLAIINAATNNNDPNPDLSSVENLVLDEADVLLDPLFRDQTMRVWDACSNPSLRISLWSATMGSSIEELTVQTIKAKSLHAPLIRLVVGLKDSSIPNISHRLTYAASEQGKLMGIRQLLHSGSSIPLSASDTGKSANSENRKPARPPFLVFTQTIPRAIALHSELLYDIPASATANHTPRIAVLHSDLSDTARDQVMSRLRRGEIWVLITTDLLSRGVDFHGINAVINYDLPNSSAAYVHRVGRTGRAGRKGGVAVTFYGKDDLPYVKNVANVIAASERQKGEGSEDEEARRWLLESLPKVSKKDKQKLKVRGVESRRARKVTGPGGERRSTRSTISTKSGYERQLENRKKAAVTSTRQRKRVGGSHGDGDVFSDTPADEGEFSGFED